MEGVGVVKGVEGAEGVEKVEGVEEWWDCREGVLQALRASEGV